MVKPYLIVCAECEEEAEVGGEVGYNIAMVQKGRLVPHQAS